VKNFHCLLRKINRLVTRIRELHKPVSPGCQRDLQALPLAVSCPGSETAIKI
jgi:hypothetical protein